MNYRFHIVANSRDEEVVKVVQLQKADQDRGQISQ